MPSLVHGMQKHKRLERAGIIYEKEDHIFAYSRSYGCQKLVLICNFSSKEKDIELSEDYENVVFVNYEQTTVIGNTLKMKPYECVIYEM